MPSFESDWRRFYPNTYPIGWMMLSAGTRPWIRFHSLPLSKQYADTDEERQILIDRQNTLANEVLGEGSPCWLTRTFCEIPEGYIAHSGPLQPLTAWPKYEFEFSFRFTVDGFHEEGKESGWNVFASLQTWTAGSFNDFLWTIASEQIDTTTIWMSPATGAVFSPYDGGVNLFIPNSQHCAELRLKHSDWLPRNP